MTTTDETDGLFGDGERRAIVEGRLQKLYHDLYGLEMNLAEEEADPHGSSAQVAQFKRDIVTVRTRIQTVHKIRNGLPKPATGDDGSGDAPTG